MMEWNMITHIVDFMVETGTQQTSSGNWNFYFDELAGEMSRHFSDIGVDEALIWLQENYLDVIDYLDERKESLSETWLNYDDEGNVEGFDINFGLAYCPNVEEEVW